jgi:uncharacterized protein (DUF433 family)
MRLPERITVDPDIMMGKPCIKGTQIPVYVLLQKMAAGESEAELWQACDLEECPSGGSAWTLFRFIPALL